MKGRLNSKDETPEGSVNEPTPSVMFGKKKKSLRKLYGSSVPSDPCVPVDFLRKFYRRQTNPESVEERSRASRNRIFGASRGV